MSVEVSATFMVHPILCDRDSAKWFGDLTGHLRDSTQMTFTKDCDSTERLGRQKARQQTAKETTLIHMSLKTGKWIENITGKVNFLIASILLFKCGPLWNSLYFNLIHFHLLLQHILHRKASELFFWSLLQHTKHRNNTRKGKPGISTPYQPLRLYTCLENL